MTTITLNRFGSSAPRLADHLLGVGQSAMALDCKLWHGTLSSWREPRLIREVAPGSKTSVLHDCCWLDFEQPCVDVALGPVTCRKVFITGYQDYPVAVEFLDQSDPCLTTERRLGLPCPTTAPQIVASQRDPSVSADKDVEGRSYAYQYRNTDGERSALSRASEAQNLYDGQTVLVSGWEVPDPEWGISEVLIYRTVNGHQTGREAGNVLDTTWMLVGSAKVDAPAFTDNKYNDDLLVALEEDIANPPPAGLKGIIHIASMNALAGYIGNRVYFSENNSYHHWPYYLDLDDNVRGLVESNGTIYAATDGHPYAIPGAVDCQNAGCRTPIRLPGSFPMMGRGNRRITAVDQGAVYPSTDGLVLLSGRNPPTLMTWPRYAPDDWQALRPETVIPVQVRGKLFVFAAGGAFAVSLGSGPEGGWQMDEHTELSDRGVTDAFVTRGGAFYIVKGGQVFEWDRGDTLRPHKYLSPEFVTPTPVNFAAAKMHHKGGGETVKIEVDGRVALTRPVITPRVFSLPNWAVGTRWQITLEGTAEVSLFSMATSMRQLGS